MDKLIELILLVDELQSELRRNHEVISVDRDLIRGKIDALLTKESFTNLVQLTGNKVNLVDRTDEYIEANFEIDNINFFALFDDVSELEGIRQ